MILNSLGQSTGHKEAVGMPTLHIGSRISEELIPKVKGCTFIVMGDFLCILGALAPAISGSPAEKLIDFSQKPLSATTFWFIYYKSLGQKRLLRDKTF